MYMLYLYHIIPRLVLYRNKINLARNINVDRATVDRMLKRWEVKEIVDDRWKRVWYVKITDFIKYLLW